MKFKQVPLVSGWKLSLRKWIQAQTNSWNVTGNVQRYDSNVSIDVITRLNHTWLVRGQRPRSRCWSCFNYQSNALKHTISKIKAVLLKFHFALLSEKDWNKPQSPEVHLCGSSFEKVHNKTVNSKKCQIRKISLILGLWCLVLQHHKRCVGFATSQEILVVLWFVQAMDITVMYEIFSQTYGKHRSLSP